MKKALLLLFLVLGPLFHYGQTAKDRKEILGILQRQSEDWSRGDVAAFMKGYLQSDSLRFVGKNGVTYGYDNTYKNYRKRYTTRADMGTLKFDILHLEFLSPKSAFLIGKFNLTRPETGDLSGHFSLVWKKIKGRWVITVDHSS